MFREDDRGRFLWRCCGWTLAKIVPAHKGLRPESPLALSLGLPIREVLAAPRFAPLTILAATHARFIMLRALR